MGYHFLLQRTFPTQGLNPGLTVLQADSLPSEPPGKPIPHLSGDQLRIKAHQGPINTRGSQEFQPKGHSVQSLSHIRLFVTPWTAAHQVSLSIPTPGACSNSYPSSRWCHPTISSSVIPFSSCLQSFIASGSHWKKWVSSSHQLAKILQFQLQHQSFQWIFRIDFL